MRVRENEDLFEIAGGAAHGQDFPITHGGLGMLIRYLVNGMLVELQGWQTALVGSIPGRIGMLLRYGVYKLSLAGLGRGCRIGRGTEFMGARAIRIGERFSVRHARIYAHEGGRIFIGDRVSVNPNCEINAAEGGEIRIGNDVMIAANSILMASNHRFDRLDVPIQQQGHAPGRIMIGSDVWIGANVFIMPDVEIGDHSIVAAGAVVTRNVPPKSVVAGVPARIIKVRA